MRKGWKALGIGLPGMVLVLGTGWLTLPRWLPAVVEHWLPAGTHLTLGGPLALTRTGLRLPPMTFRAGTCRLADSSAARLDYRHGRWVLTADSLTLDSACLSQLPAGAPGGAPFSPAAWQQRLPPLEIAINHLTLAPWQPYAGRLTFSSGAAGQHLRYLSRETAANGAPQLALDASLDRHQHLTLTRFAVTLAGMEAPLTLAGRVTLPVAPGSSLPDQGDLQAHLTLAGVPAPLAVTLNWQAAQGTLEVAAQDAPAPLLRLPWQLSPAALTIHDGTWRWPYATQPLAGGLRLTLRDWDSHFTRATLEGRANMLTQGHNGRANVVLSAGPGSVGLTESDLRLQLTGQANAARLSFTASLPAWLHGPLLSPALTLRSGALLRAWGNLTAKQRLEEARWPLAGVTLSPAGINGPLQAIVRLTDRYWGAVKLHLNGKAQDFWPDRGHWQYNFWGNGTLPPLQARWDMTGKGRWDAARLTVSSLSTGFNQLHYGLVTVDKPRLTLSEPLVWQRPSEARAPTPEAIQGGLTLAAERIGLGSGGYLPPSSLALQIKGASPAAFLWRGSLAADPIGPIALRGRWDGERLRGEGWWPDQPLTAFQSLLDPALKITLRDGRFRAQTAFSAAREQGLVAGGHWVVQQGGAWLKDGEVSGVDFILPYRLDNHRWQFGAQQPVSLRIGLLSNLVAMKNITADLQGNYPYSEHLPLTLSNVGVDMLGGHVSLSALRLPQHQAAVLKLDQVDLSEVFTALKPKQFAMSGKVDGELPLWLDNPHWLVKEGWVRNHGLLTLRLAPEMAKALAEGNLTNRLVVDWLRYLEISRTSAQVSLDNLGELTLAAKIDGVSPAETQRRNIILNYRHQENVFQLWRSLRFGDNVQEWLSERLSKSARTQP
ncbi:YdbH family protein [Chimaeribacter arupi]|uniref:YdbH family protein n=1 Tax=Chimaeribacter arupi TaxID=2060066 RepID=UPI002945A05B|nr:YdbH family protein [Chimaeribacter arupi]MDV5139156.1 YdbH family protein [Chimaeribacter arupi]